MLPLLAGILTPLISSITTAIGSITAALPAIGAQISAFIAKIPGPILEKVFSGMLDIVKAMVKIIFNIDSSCGELGYKAKIADRNQEDFKSPTEYLDYLNKEVKFDKEEFEKLPDSEKMECNLRGMHIAHKSIEDKYGIFVSPLFFALNTALKIQPDVIVRALDVIKEAGVTTDDFVDYFKGTLSLDKAKTVDDMIKKLFNAENDSSSILNMMRQTREMGF